MRFFLSFLFVSTLAHARDFYSIKERSIQGKDISLSSFKGKTVLVVNIASQCGYTPQLEKLETLYQKYKSKDFVVLGVPTNDFKGQTPEDDKAMLEFCQKNYSATFPILTKKTVQGEGKRDLYKLLTEETPKDLRGEIVWNFEKFLVDKKGQVIGRWHPKVDPMDPELIKKIESVL